MNVDSPAVERFLTDTLWPTLMTVGLRVLGALALWIVGRWIIRLVLQGLDRILVARGIEATLRRYVDSALSVLLAGVLIIAVFGYLGVQVATFAALLAGAGLAIGTAWGDLLKNFAAGFFLLIMRPYRVGDLVTVGGINGTVEEVGVFSTVVNVGDNVRAYVGNAKVFGDNILNHSAFPTRRAELKMQLGHAADAGRVMTAIEEQLPRLPNVLEKPAPEVALIELNANGPLLAVRYSTKAEHALALQNEVFRTVSGLLAPGDRPVPPAPPPRA
jgi:small conductance mechanosensitive channel